MNSTDTTTFNNCPSPLIPNPEPGLYNINCRIFDDGSDCCIPCPLLDYAYPHKKSIDALNMFKLSGFIISMVSCFIILLYYLYFKKSRNNSLFLMNGTLGLFIMSASSILTLIFGTKSMACAGPTTQSSLLNNNQCFIQASIYHVGTNVVVTFGLFTIIHLHLLIVWARNLFHKTQLVCVAAGWIFSIMLSVFSLLQKNGRYANLSHCSPTFGTVGLLYFTFAALIAFPLHIVTASYLYMASKKLSEHDNQNMDNQNDADEKNDSLLALRKEPLMIRNLRLQWRPALIAINFGIGWLCAFAGVLVGRSEKTGLLDQKIWVWDWIACFFNSSADSATSQTVCSELARPHVIPMTYLIIFGVFPIWLGFIMLATLMGEITSTEQMEHTKRVVYRVFWSFSPKNEHDAEVEGGDSPYEPTDSESMTSRNSTLVYTRESSETSRTVKLSNSLSIEIDSYMPQHLVRKYSLTPTSASSTIPLPINVPPPIYQQSNRLSIIHE